MKPLKLSVPRLTLGLAVSLTLLAAVACGNGPTSSGGNSAAPQNGQPAGSTKVTLSEFKFDPNALSVKGGDVVFFVVNSGATSHDMVIVDASGTVVKKTDLLQGGDSASLKVTLQPGTYKFFCDVSGHRSAGMEGTLTVT